ncbi:PIG-L family deacetylase [Paenibacillus sp. N1-5-1-14]|uniref:PIG-L deacetylase family protein n=1 Tax=Paenibacillus radicibacter TaxID=2972488 RepID=UPI002159352C|nr:PIG-L deacetylase family protein [Paenibacillus radicibacter]MCR8641091.1 PIG-L family deacetylase [Paenibacillus radicibacter]
MDKKIVVLSPHTDDGELGCGGTIAKAIEMGHEVYYLAFTGAEISVPAGFPSDILRQEVKKATRVLGMQADHVEVLTYPVREFSSCRQEILEDLVKMNRRIQPDIVYLPSLRDRHQDHHVIANEGLRAFKSASIFSYELPWNNVEFAAQGFSEIEDRFLQRKIEALSCYESQSHRPYMTESFLKGWANMRGVQCGKTYAEAFEIVRTFL